MSTSLAATTITLPSTPPGELAHFSAELARFRRGALDAESFRKFRLGFGVYGQKQPGVHMIRVKLPAGIVNAAQFAGLAALAEEFGHGTLHLTTRQDVQFHFVPLEKVPALLSRVEALGLTTREACGSTVRNLTACPTAGATADEGFDVRPYVQAAAAYLLRNPLSQQLARKFKLAFSACPEECALAAIHDLGFVGVVRDDDGLRRIGFRVLVGGGLGATPFVARELLPFLSPDELLPALRAVLKVYAAHGNRRQRTRARLKFLVAAQGIEGFRARFLAELAALDETELHEARLQDYLTPEWRFIHARQSAAEFTADESFASPLPDSARQDGYGHWLRRQVRRHRDSALALVNVSVPLGDLTAGEAERLTLLANRHGRGEIRLTIDQNLLLPTVEIARLPLLHRELIAAGFARADAGTALALTACAGADTCAIGLTSAKGISRALEAALAPLAARYGVDALAGLTIKISGCPNACGQHHIADIGLHGVVLKSFGRPIPGYQLHLGGSAGSGGAVIARASLKLPARRTPAVVATLVERWLKARAPVESFTQFLDRTGAAQVDEWLRPFADLNGGGLALDWGQREAFAVRAVAAAAPSDADADALAETEVELKRATHLLANDLKGDALAAQQRAHYLLARALLKPLGKTPDSDFETACELRARLIDRGHLSEGWNEQLARIEAALRFRAPDAASVLTIQAAFVALLAESRVLLPALAAMKKEEGPAELSA